MDLLFARRSPSVYVTSSFAPAYPICATQYFSNLLHLRCTRHLNDLHVLGQRTSRRYVSDLKGLIHSVSPASRIEYYDHWPSSEYHVKIEQKPLENDVSLKPGQHGVKRLTIVAKKDFASGEVIYREQPMATALDVDLEVGSLKIFGHLIVYSYIILAGKRNALLTLPTSFGRVHVDKGSR